MEVAHKLMSYFLRTRETKGKPRIPATLLIATDELCLRRAGSSLYIACVRAFHVVLVVVGIPCSVIVQVRWISYQIKDLKIAALKSACYLHGR
jgi:hypothetical protein